MLISGWCRRFEVKWMARATSSLPVPLRPVISTLLSVFDTFSISLNTFCMASLWPTRFSNV